MAPRSRGANGAGGRPLYCRGCDGRALRRPECCRRLGGVGRALPQARGVADALQRALRPHHPRAGGGRPARRHLLLGLPDACQRLVRRQHDGRVQPIGHRVGHRHQLGARARLRRASARGHERAELAARLLHGAQPQALHRVRALERRRRRAAHAPLQAAARDRGRAPLPARAAPAQLDHRERLDVRPLDARAPHHVGALPARRRRRRGGRRHPRAGRGLPPRPRVRHRGRGEQLRRAGRAAVPPRLRPRGWRRLAVLHGRLAEGARVVGGAGVGSAAPMLGVKPRGAARARGSRLAAQGGAGAASGPATRVRRP
mmetsp:Transcript_7640/g.17860  ORF Transcript_7640/g.17860 Transcript_7640/m.17860 type:complete len:315 (+) Transcript_7640:478-1422(+)